MTSVSQKMRPGYTLIEMIIATALVGTLMTVAFGLMSMYSRFLTAGQSVASEQQLIRSMFQTFETDLQNVAIADSGVQIQFQTGPVDTQPFPATASDSAVNPLIESSNAPSDEMLSSEPSVLADLFATAQTTSPGRVSFVGNSRAIRLSILSEASDIFRTSSETGFGETGLSGNQTNPSLVDDPNNTTLASPRTIHAAPSESANTEEGTSPRVEEFQTVIWQYHPYGLTSGGTQQLQPGLYRIQAGTSELLAALQQKETLLESPTSAEGDVSVDQTTLETLLYSTETSQADRGANTFEQPTARPAFDLIPEVVDCQFEYFSGSTWESSWNSEIRKELPVAVRVRIRLAAPENLERLSALTGASATSDSVVNDAVESRMSTAKDATVTDDISSGDEGSGFPKAIPTRDIQQIILLQPITGELPILEKSEGTMDGPSPSSLPSDSFPPQASLRHPAAAVSTEGGHA